MSMAQHFDEQARDWDSDIKKVERARAVAQAMRSAIPMARSMRALEYGCGTGLLSFELKDDLGQITMADTSDGMLQVLREKIGAAQAENLTAVRLDLSSEPIPPERYDLTYSLMVLHHIPDTGGILRAFYEILHPGGILCICDLDQEDGSFHTGEFDGHLGFERRALEQSVKEAGFQDIRISTAHEMHKNGRGYPLFLLAARKPAGAP
jgi:ubiquinone/menaquinone biosynthesis C-methylase UbiE